MRIKHIILPWLISCLMLSTVMSVSAEQLIEPLAAEQPLMVTTKDSKIYALIGEHITPVGVMSAGQAMRISPVAAQFYEFTFGHGTGFIDKNDVAAIQQTQPVNDSLGDLHKSLTNQNLLTHQPTKVHVKPEAGSAVFGELAENLRYPIIGKLKDPQGITWYQVNVADRLGYISSQDSEIDNGIPILTYHHLLRDAENKRFRNTSTTTSDTAFGHQMAYLKQAGYETISLYQLEKYLNNRINLPAKVVVLTFDDGLKSVYRYAYPILKEYNFQATAFIITSRIKRHPEAWNPDSLQFMSISELEKIQDVFDLQSHTHFLHRTDNKRHPILLSRSQHNIEFDFEHSRRALEPFNNNVVYLSYPFGGYNQKAIEAARESGLRMAVTTVRGKVKPGDNLYTLKRLYILRTDSIAAMAERISNSASKEALESQGSSDEIVDH